jgi:esterase/lipase superfamily enzyme
MKRLRFLWATALSISPLLLSISCSMIKPPAAESVVVPVYYATDRKALMPLEAWQSQFCKKGSECQYYGGEYNPTNLELGVCPVNVPATGHRTGMVERPSWYEFGESHDRYFSLTGLRPLRSDEFFADLNKRLANSPAQDVFVFIHGYNVTFSSAIFYTSQLDWDWGFAGVPILYSWPSDGSLFGYPKDEESVRLTETHLRWFLQQILTKSSATNVHLIAHSIGNRALTEVLRTFITETKQPVFGEVILAAPDVNRIGFLQEMADVLPKVARHVTLYSSSGDKAMKLSRSFHQYGRAGDAGDDPMVSEGIDTIDASAAETDLLGHSYVLNAPVVIDDMAAVLCRGLPPEQRNLTRVDKNGRSYWKLKSQIAAK